MEPGNRLDSLSLDSILDFQAVRLKAPAAMVDHASRQAYIPIMSAAHDQSVVAFICVTQVKGVGSPCHPETAPDLG